MRQTFTTAIRVVLLCLVASAVLTACKKKRPFTEQDKKDVEDILRATSEDSLRDMTDIYTAWAQRDLKGKVREMITNVVVSDKSFTNECEQAMRPDTVMFDSLGAVTYERRDTFMSVSFKPQYDGYGRIIQIGDNDNNTSYVYNEEGKLVREVNYYTVNGEVSKDEITYTYEYKWMEMKRTAEGPAAKSPFSRHYEYVATDEEGNWTKANMTVETVSHKEGQPDDTIKAYYIVNRQIGYY